MEGLGWGWTWGSERPFPTSVDSIGSYLFRYISLFFMTLTSGRLTEAIALVLPHVAAAAALQPPEEQLCWGLRAAEVCGGAQSTCQCNASNCCHPLLCQRIPICRLWILFQWGSLPVSATVPGRKLMACTGAA